MRLNALIPLRVRHWLVVVTVMLSGSLLNAAPVLGADTIEFVPPDPLYEPYKLPDYQPSDVRSNTQRLSKQPYEVESDRAAKAFMDELVKSICAMRKDGQVKKSSQTTVPQAKALLDELKYLSERTLDRLVNETTEINESLSYLLFHSEQPSLTGIQNPFVKFTKEPTLDVEGLPFPVSRELALALKVNQAKDNSLAPKDVLKMALEVSGGDYPAATLLAHNFLKEITYSGRSRFESSFATVSGFPESDAAAKAANANRRKEYQTALRKNAPDFVVYPRENGVLTIGMETGAPALAAKFRNLRVAGDPHVEDKLGPWYHSFGVLFLSTSAKGGRFTAETWANVEGLARHVPIFSSSPDYFKELFTNLAGEQSGAIIDCLDKEQGTMVSSVNGTWKIGTGVLVNQWTLGDSSGSWVTGGFSVKDSMKLNFTYKLVGDTIYIYGLPGTDMGDHSPYKVTISSGGMSWQSIEFPAVKHVFIKAK